MAEQEYTFEDNEEKVGFASKLNNACQFLWNSQRKEFCGRDGASWAKISLFYTVFYAALGSFFVGQLAVFMYIMPKDKPTYYGKSSVMNARGVNPGLGFRPQIDVEDLVIKYAPTVVIDKEFGYQKYVDNLNYFLDSKYSEQANGNTIKCDKNNTYDEQLNMGKSCKFDYKEVFTSTGCTRDNAYGYRTNFPCILIKLNKIVSWKPDAPNGYISVRCAGEHSFDQDNIKKIEYYSEGRKNDTLEGIIDNKFFPFTAQKDFKMPFVFARILVNPDTLVNIECKAYAANIDNDDRMNRRGQTKFALYIQS